MKRGGRALRFIPLSARRFQGLLNIFILVQWLTRAGRTPKLTSFSNKGPVYEI